MKLMLAYEEIRHTPEFQNELADLLQIMSAVQVLYFMQNAFQNS